MSRSPSPHPKTQSRGRSQSRSPPRHRALSRSPHPGPRSRGRSHSRSPSPRRRSFSRSRSRSRSRSSRVDPTNPGNTLYVTGLSSRVTERALEDHFSKEGKVAECRLIVEPRTRISRGFAFISMDTIEDADRCVKYLNHSVLEGRHITVEKSKRQRPRTPTPGNYLGLKNTRDSYRGRYRGGGYGREEYSGGYRRSPRRSPYRGSRDYSPRRSPYGGRSRRDRSYSPYRSPERSSYGRRSSAYAR
ncbi:serine/arginine-rich splicing factor SR45a isoform X1 [Asparagus officinalis]|uniref:serine/arginine-rich splicing factor SR45a isoform X1 n=1 Tax=Asparagus officinalis TaxID=4686 RepID=UPI00098E151D|nr:serine/arginine-rich splicing factor SR45a isoform X1 [Asparagus officinalis]